ncbi:cysteine proteinase inhibitor 3-like [Cornus florida]|uniref:cysteine proteinase inhibitor 3-like n=1 Tax=Cornus florida TaxID=4283 RepID=UPI00289CE658|nr:cysteine proteinase inhibitor 3-like [Cornus florida]
MALRSLLLGSGRVKNCANPTIGVWGSVKQSLWRNPSSSCSCSCLQRNGSSISGPVGEVIRTQDDTVRLGGTSIYEGAQEDEWIISLAKSAINQHNQNQNGELQFVRVVGASHTGASSLLYHITLVATNARKQKIYHTVVWLQLWRNLMELLVWKPVNDALSAVGVKRGDLMLHEAVMFYMNQQKSDFPRM